MRIFWVHICTRAEVRKTTSSKSEQIYKKHYNFERTGQVSIACDVSLHFFVFCSGLLECETVFLIAQLRHGVESATNTALVHRTGKKIVQAPRHALEWPVTFHWSLDQQTLQLSAHI